MPEFIVLSANAGQDELLVLVAQAKQISVHEAYARMIPVNRVKIQDFATHKQLIARGPHGQREFYLYKLEGVRKVQIDRFFKKGQIVICPKQPNLHPTKEINVAFSVTAKAALLTSSLGNFA